MPLGSGRSAVGDQERNNVRKRTKLSVSLLTAFAAVGALVLSMGTALPAQAATADYEPGAHDIVGVGSDTLQFILDFGDDGDAVGDPGYNNAGNAYKVVSIDATADSNARASYLNNSTDADLLPLDGTAVLRAGTYPIQRPNGSSAGITAMLADTSTADPYLDFVRMSRAPASSEAQDAVNNGWQGLQVVTLGNENLRMAADLTTNAPAGLSLQQLIQIYECNDTTWTQVGGTSTAAIIPAIPQTGSGTRSQFLSDLQAANGGTAITLGSCVITVEENDPTGITGNTSPANVIVPFSGSRLNLWNGDSGDTTIQPSSGVGYFHSPTTVYPGASTALVPGVAQLTGTPSDGNPVYDDVRNLYVVYRWTDQISTTPWQPGGKLNWAQTLFCDPGGPAPYFDTAPGEALIAQAGANPDFSCLSSPMT
jgi:ABC-type phosphate transport system substrate-binding protein